MITRQEKINEILKSLKPIKDYSNFEATKLINDLLLENQGIAGFINGLSDNYGYYKHNDSDYDDDPSIENHNEVDLDSYTSLEIDFLQERQIAWILKSYIKDQAYSLSNRWFTINPDLNYTRMFENEYNQVLNELLEVLELYFLTQITPS